MKLRSTFFALIVLGLAAGCGPKDINAGRQMGTLKGKLTINGKPFSPKTGLSFQHVETGQLYIAMTEPDGAFEVKMPARTMPAGRYDLTIQPAGMIEDRSKEAAAAALGDTPTSAPVQGAVKEVPAKYRNAHESGLSFDLNAGANDLPIDVKP